VRTIPEPDDRVGANFLRGAFVFLAVRAAHQRNQTFAKDVGYNDAARKILRDDLYRGLRNLEDAYRAGGVSDDRHIDKIVQLADGVTKDPTEALHGSRYRIGTAQKAVNLYLKYLWCADLIAEPPHCPFDNQIIGRLPNVPREWRNWTTVDDPEAYERWVQEARTLARDRSLARWELDVWRPQ
jgi:hypothetical protein